MGGNKQYHSPGHVDFSNHFAFNNANNELILPQSHFSFNKHPSQNELQPNHFYFVNQNDEFTRNLVPPPPIYRPQGEKENVLPKEPSKIIEQSATVNTPQLVIGNHKDEMRHVPENFIGQPPYNKFSQHQNIGIPGFDLEITKEKFKEYHTTLAPSSFKTSTESFLDTSRFTKPKKEFTKSSLATLQHAYEVTEEKEWNEHNIPPFKPVQQTYSTLNPHLNGGGPPTLQNKYIPNKFHYSQQIILQDQDDEEPSGPQFLPTPYSPESAFPTSPTQAEVSTIYSEISQLNKMKNPFKVPEPTTYNIKEVATHFPFFETRKPDIITTPKNIHQTHHQFIQEVTTKQQLEEETESTLPYIKPTQQTTIQTKPTYATSPKRPGHRRRRPIKPTTEAGEFITDVEQEKTTEKPQRRRRPIKYRTTESSDQMSHLEASTRPATITYRPRPTRPQVQTITEEQFVNRERYRPNYKLPPQVQVDDEEEKNHPRQYSKFNRQREDNKYRKEVYTEENSEEGVTHFRLDNHQEFGESPTTEIAINNYNKYTEEVPVENEQTTVKLKKRKRLRPLPPTTELSPSTNLNIPENDIEYTTLSTNDDPSEESVTIREVYNYENEKETTTLLTTPPTTTSQTTSTSSESTTKSNRIRRPVKYDIQRPRFSVKDYRQRLNQYMSTTADPTKFTSEGTSSSPRIRYPNRFKISTTVAVENEEVTENNRQKFIPKDPRHRQQYQSQAPQQHLTETTESTSEKYSRTASPRIRPFGRYRSTTETAPLTSSTTQKVSIKPNIFTNLKRPQHLSLRNRIYNKRNSTTTTELITDIPDVEDSASHTERTEVTIPFESAESKIEITTQIYEFNKSNHHDDETDIEEDTTNAPLLPTIRTKIKHVDLNEPEVVTPDEAEAFLQLQRISDLTSSAHKQYNTPGLFKSVSPTSRRVPNYFTIATEDPILPIEAFFPNLNKHNDKQN